jgi:hypothetical protein
LADGIARRAEVLSHARTAGRANAALFEEVGRVAHEAADVAEGAFADAVRLPSPAGSAAEDLTPTDPGGAAAVEQLTSQLLSIASALDDAIALEESRSPPAEATAAMLRHLQQNVAVARTTLPEIRLLRGAAGPSQERR